MSSAPLVRGGAPAVRLTGRRSSHFTRVAMMFAYELRVPFELVVAHDLLSVDPDTFGGNPALKIPALHVGTTQVLGTENVCRALVEHAGRSGDPSIVLAEHTTDAYVRSAQELVWCGMLAQVQLRMGVTMSRLPADNPFFVKAASGLTGALAWLDARLADLRARLFEGRQLSVFEVTLFCLVEHLAFRPSVSLDPFPRLVGFAASFGARASAQRTSYRIDPAPGGEPS